MVSAASPQAGSSQTIQAGSGTNSQGDSTIPPHSGTSWAEGTDGQAVSTSPQTVSTNSEGVSIASQQAGSSQAINNGTNSQGISATPQAVQPSRQVNNANRSPNDNSLEDLNPKWVINLSSKPLTQAQRSVLAKGPNFAATPRHPLNLEHIMAIELVCTKFGQQDAEELRAEINRVLKSSHPSPNLT